MPLVEVLHAEAAGDVVVREQTDTDLAFYIAHSLRKEWSAALVDHAVDAARERGMGGRDTLSGLLRTSADARAQDERAACGTFMVFVRDKGSE